jgi:hypothetical protein
MTVAFVGVVTLLETHSLAELVIFEEIFYIARRFTFFRMIDFFYKACSMSGY